MDLTSRYLGLDLRNPLVASASPLAGTADGVRALADAGWARWSSRPCSRRNSSVRWDANAALADAGRKASRNHCPTSRPRELGEAGAEVTPRRYLNLVERAAAAVNVPVIASLNGVTTGGWTDYATALQEAGAAAIELNIYHLPGDPMIPGRDVEQRHVEIMTTVKAVVNVPVAVKLSPYFSSPGEMALRLDGVGADGLVLFNRFIQPDIDPEALTITVGFGLSSPAEGRLPRAWIARLAGRVGASLAASTGVGRAGGRGGLPAGRGGRGDDHVGPAAERARVRHHPARRVEAWMERHGFSSVASLRGKLAAPASLADSVYQRAGYVSTLRAANQEHGPYTPAR